MNRVTHIPTAATSATRISAPRRLWICRVGDSCCAPAHNPWITPARNPGKEDISNEIRLRTFLMWFDTGPRNIHLESLAEAAHSLRAS